MRDELLLVPDWVHVISVDELGVHSSVGDGFVHDDERANELV